GQTESSGICVLHPDTDVRADTLGKPTPGTRVRVSDSGEILVAGENVFLGYYKNPDATAQAITNGWLSTGDAGLVDDRGHLVMIDRLTDGLRPARRPPVSPAPLQKQQQVSPAA